MGMYSSYYIEHYDFSDPMEKSASVGRDTCRNIMRRIYNENPSYWPYGLNIEGHQSVYLIKESATNKPIGFVGWQEFTEGYPMKKIGSYSIGILPEYRGHDYASEAVSKILRAKAASVQEVRCYVVSGNKKSQGLANKLGIKCYNKF